MPLLCVTAAVPSRGRFNRRQIGRSRSTKFRANHAMTRRVGLARLQVSTNSNSTSIFTASFIKNVGSNTPLLTKACLKVFTIRDNLDQGYSQFHVLIKLSRTIVALVCPIAEARRPAGREAGLVRHTAFSISSPHTEHLNQNSASISNSRNMFARSHTRVSLAAALCLMYMSFACALRYRSLSQ